MNKKKWIITGSIVLAIILVILTVVIIVSKNKNETTNVPEDNYVRSENRLLKYIDSLGDNYYIYYSGEFENTSSDTVKASIYYSFDNGSFAMKSEELNIHIVFKENKLYNISHIYGLIVVMDKEAVDISKYNLISTEKKDFVRESSEDNYIVEEYFMKDTTVKYYFEENTLKKIKVGKEGVFKDISFTVEKNTRQDIFVIDDSYEKMYA